MRKHDVYRKAADHMERVGKCEGAFFKWPSLPEYSPCCLLGAVGFVLGGFPNINAVRTDFTDSGTLIEGLFGVSHWSDTHSEGEVVTALRCAAAYFASTAPWEQMTADSSRFGELK